MIALDSTPNAHGEFKRHQSERDLKVILKRLKKGKCLDQFERAIASQVGDDGEL